MAKNITRMNNAARGNSTGDWWDEFYIANCMGAQRIVRYLSPFEVNSWLVEEVKVTAKKVANRTGVPATATTWAYTFKTDAFSVVVRAVWHRGDLFGPVKTHTRVTKVMPNDEGARRAFNEWLRSISAL